MKKFLLLLICFLFLQVNAQTLKAGVSEDYIPKGFFGSWAVISKLNSSNNPSVFNYESRDIWVLSGYNNILILENQQSGARSEITIEQKSKDNRTLTFKREKTVNPKSGKIIYKETVSFKLMGPNFSGIDEFVVERYDENNKFIKKDIATYQIAGVRISGENP